MVSEPSARDLFLQSLDRCARSEGFIPSFYDRFLGSSDEVRAKFVNTDFAKQNKMLLRSLQLVAGATAGETEALSELRERAETHDRHHLNIRPELYELWQRAIVETAREFDKDWNDEVESAWQTVLGHAVQHMVRHY